MKVLARLLRFALIGLGASVFILALLIFFAWLLFPRDFVRQVPEKVLNRTLPQWQWQVDAVQYEPPLALRLAQLEARPRNVGFQSALPVQIDSLILQPDWFYLLRKQEWRGSFAAGLADGVIDGKLSLHTDKGQQDLVLATEFDALNLAALPWLKQMLDREVQGRLSGRGEARLGLQSGTPADVQARLEMAAGVIPLRNPVLGHGQLPFTRLSLKLEQQGQNLILKNGILDSPLGKGEFTGQVALVRPLASSSIAVRGVLQAGPELFSHVRDQQDLQGFRLQAARGPLAVSLSGSLKDPALAFERGALPVNPAPLLSPNQEQSTAP
ncbi:MAG: type II secretion system protein GspN [Desulfobulbaceae bacterium]|nr:type II secretion system protein GspN [Desulfobulbaceae bacterium]